MAVFSSELLNNVSLWQIVETVLIALIVFIVFKVVEFWLYVRKMEKIFKDAPGPHGYHWLFGSIFHFPKDADERARYFIELGNKHGDKGYFFMWAPFRTPIIVPTSPKILAIICKTTEPKVKSIAGGYRMLKPWLGDGLLISKGNTWARNRRLLTPAFHFDILKPYMKVYNESADKLVKKWSMHAEAGESFEVFQNVLLCTLEVILRCAFSYEQDVQAAGDTNPYVKAVNNVIRAMYIRFLKPWLMVDFLFWFSELGRQNRKDVAYLHSVSEEVIESRRKTLVFSAEDIIHDAIQYLLFTIVQEKEGPPTKRHLDFLDILLQARDETGQGLTPLEIRNEVDTFLFEGHDTTGSAISWILYSLAENADCQRRCQEEIDAVLDGRDTEDIQLSDFAQLEYLTMCIKEGMRLHCPVPIVARQTEREYDVGDRVVPPDVIFQINVLVMSHMENIWGKNHMDFVPERFTKDNISEMDPFQFVPFSAGPRNCIGQNFALNEEKVILAKLLRNFTFSLDPNHKVKKCLTAVMRPVEGIHVYAEKRNIKKSAK